MSNRASAYLLLSSCLLGTLLFGCAAPDMADEEDDLVVAASEGLSMAQVPNVDDARDWLRWAFAQPWSTGPVNDTTGAQCAAGQTGSRWFLAGTTGGAVTRTCTIPAGKTLIVPLINRWVAFRPEVYPDADAIVKVQNQVDNYFKQQLARTCDLTLKVDGVSVAGDYDQMLDDLYVEETTPFNVYLYPGDNYLTPSGTPTGINGGDIPAETAGHYIEIGPLSPGDHVLELGGKVCQNKNQVLFETSATYDLHIDN